MNQPHRSTQRRAAAASPLLLLLVLGASACTDRADPFSPTAAPGISTAAGGRPKGTPTRGLIAFSHSVSGNQEIYTVAEDGSGLRRLTYNVEPDDSPSWSPDARKLAYVSQRGGRREIHVMNADGSGGKQLSKLAPAITAVTDVAWSPDGRRIAFAARAEGEDYRDVYVMSASGSSVTRLTTADGDDLQPTWSPDGERIAFASAGGVPGDPFEVYMMDPDGSNVARETDCAFNCWHPDWSPDGARLAYNELYSIRIKNLATSYVADFAEMAGGPAWSPDGVRLVYTRVDDFGILMTISADATGADTLVSFPNSWAAWDADWGR